MGRRFVLVAVVALLAAVVPVAASASTQTAGGTFVQGAETIVDERVVGDSIAYTIDREVTFSGTYDGVGQAREVVLVHPDGSTHVAGVIHLTGLICGEPGSVRMVIVGKGSLVEMVVGGTYTVFGAPSGRRVVGHGAFSGEAGGAGAYEGKAAC
jgi:hypothetical protein